MSIAVGAVFAASGTPLLANPSGASVVAGSASFATAGNTLTITNTPGTIINWQQFSIAKDEITRFIQQHASSAVLNRVLGQDPSVILGQLQSNGRVFLINPSGIVFGQGAVINVAGFTASTLNISDADFIAGRLRFSGIGNEGKISNAGEISTPAGGHVYLIAPKVENEATGVIRSPNGEVIIAAGKTVELVHALTPDIRVEFTAPDNEAVNAGEIVAASGRIGVYGTLIKNSGIVSATRAVVGEGGKIVFKAVKDITLDPTSRLEANGAKGGTVTAQAQGGTLLAQGTIEATGSEDKGGKIQLLGEHVSIAGETRIDASGKSGGGTILIGGDYQGKNADVQNALTTAVGEGVSIKADADSEGDGGKVILWADGTTTFRGHISARGGAQGGNGGFAEVSGKEHLLVSGHADLRAPRGRAGTILLDPGTVTIQHGPNEDPDTLDVINDGWIEVQLSGGDLAITTNNGTVGPADITVNPDVSISWTSNTLELIAGSNIVLDGSFSGAGGTLSLTAGNAIDLSAAPTIEAGKTVTASAPTVFGPNAAAMWTTTADSAAMLSYGSNADIALTGVSTINGGSQQDTFNLGHSVASVNGGDGNDTFTVSVAITSNLNGGAGADTFTLDGALTGDVVGGAGADTLQGGALSDAVLTSAGATNEFGGTITGISGSFSGISTLNASGSLTGLDANSQWVSTGANAGTYETGGQTLTFSGFSTWNGGSQQDTFNLGHSVASVNGGDGNDTFNIAAVVVGAFSVEGQSGTDVINTTGLISSTGPVNLAAETVNLGAGITTSSADLSVTGNINLGTSIALSTDAGVGDITVDGTVSGGHGLTLMAGSGAISVTGPVTIASLEVDSSSASTFAGNVNLTGGASLSATAGDVSFLNGLTAGATSTFANTGFLQLGDATSDVSFLTGGLTHTAGRTVLAGDITTGGAVSLGATEIATGVIATLHAGASAVTFNSTVDGPGGLDVDASGTTTFNGAVGGTTALESLRLRGGGVTVINGPSVRTTDFQDYQDQLMVPGALSLTSAGNGSITATHGSNDFGGALTLTGGRIRITDANDLLLGPVTSNSHIDVHTGDDLTINGQMTSGGGWITLLAGQSAGMLANTAADTNPNKGAVRINQAIDAGTGQVRIVTAGDATGSPSENDVTQGPAGGISASVLTVVTLKGDGSGAPTAGGANILLDQATGPGNTAQTINLLACPAGGCPDLPPEIAPPTGVAALSELVQKPVGTQYANGELRYIGTSGGQPVEISGIGTTNEFFAYVNGSFTLTAFPFSANKVTLEAVGGDIILDLNTPLQKINDAAVGELTFRATGDISMTNLATNTIGTSGQTFNHHLTMQAGGNIDIDNSIYLGTGKNLVLAADATFTHQTGQVVTSDGIGDVTLRGNHSVVVGGDATITGQNVYILGGATGGVQDLSGQVLKVAGTLEFANAGEIVIRGGASNASSGSGAWVSGGTVKIGTPTSRPTRLTIEGGANTHGWETANASDARRETRQSNAVLQSLGAMTIYLGSHAGPVQEAPTFDGTTFAPGNDLQFGSNYGLVIRGGTVDSQNADGPNGAVAGFTVAAGNTRTVTALGAIQAGSLDLEVDGSILLQGGAANIRAGATIADTSAVLLVTGQKNIRTVNPSNNGAPGYGSLVVKGGNAYNGTGNANLAPNLRARAQVDPTNLNVQTAGIVVLHGGIGPIGSLTSARMDATDSIAVNVGSSALTYTYTDALGNPRSVTGQLILIGGAGSGTFGKDDIPLPLPNHLIPTNVPLTQVLESQFGDAVIQVGRTPFDSSLLSYIIFAANEETRAARIRRGLGEGDDLGAPACQ